jgi:hypothetical protein
MKTVTQVLEVHLEEVGQHSWFAGLTNLLGAGLGSAQFRFVARPPGADEDSADHVLGATFPVMRMQDLNSRRRPNAWIETVEERLEELDDQLVRDGWVRRPETGRHWWSRTYTRQEATPQS